MRVRGYLDEALFGAAGSVVARRIRWGVLAVLYLVGVGYWVNFFNAGGVSFTVADWVWQAGALNTIRSALSGGVAPWQWHVPPGAAASYQIRFLLSIVPWTPDVVLLPVMSTTVFALVHTLLCYSVGFVGSLRLLRRVRSNLVTFTLFWLLFNFNGFISAQLAVGHFEYTGYFLLPIFLELALGASVRSGDPSSGTDVRGGLWLGLLIGALVVNGSVHVAVWCCGFLVIMAAWRWRLIPTMAIAVASGVGIGLCRLLPSALFVPNPGPFVSGFPDVGVLLAGLATVRIPDYAYVLGGNWGKLNWWEYDVYIGSAALLVVVVATIFAFRRHHHRRIAPALAAAAVLFLFSLGDNYALVIRVFSALARSERTSSRLIVIPLLLLMVIATEGLVLALSRWPRTGRVCALIAIPVIAYQLVLHARYWTVPGIELRLPVDDVSPAAWLIPNADPRYTAVVLGSSLVSLVVLGAVAALLWRGRTEAAGEAAGTARPATAASTGGDGLIYETRDGAAA